MFDVGFTELFLLSVIGLLVLGPERLPGVARTIGGFVRKARLSYNNLKRTVEAELAAADAVNPIKQAKDEFEAVQQQVSDLGKQLDQEVSSPSIRPNDDQPALTPAAQDDDQQQEAGSDQAEDPARLEAQKTDSASNAVKTDDSAPVDGSSTPEKAP